MKYVMMKAKRSKLTILVPIIFPHFIPHEEVAKHSKHILQHIPGFEDVEPISAGNYNIINGTCGGSSKTLKLIPDKRDSRVILMYDYEHGLL